MAHLNRITEDFPRAAGSTESNAQRGDDHIGGGFGESVVVFSDPSIARRRSRRHRQRRSETVPEQRAGGGGGSLESTPEKPSAAAAEGGQCSSSTAASTDSDAAGLGLGLGFGRASLSDNDGDVAPLSFGRPAHSRRRREVIDYGVSGGVGVAALATIAPSSPPISLLPVVDRQEYRLGSDRSHRVPSGGFLANPTYAAGSPATNSSADPTTGPAEHSEQPSFATAVTAAGESCAYGGAKSETEANEAGFGGSRIAEPGGTEGSFSAGSVEFASSAGAGEPRLPANIKAIRVRNNNNNEFRASEVHALNTVASGELLISHRHFNAAPRAVNSTNASTTTASARATACGLLLSPPPKGGAACRTSEQHGASDPRGATAGSPALSPACSPHHAFAQLPAPMASGRSVPFLPQPERQISSAVDAVVFLPSTRPVSEGCGPPLGALPVFSAAAAVAAAAASSGVGGPGAARSPIWSPSRYPHRSSPTCSASVCTPPNVSPPTAGAPPFVNTSMCGSALLDCHGTRKGVSVSPTPCSNAACAKASSPTLPVGSPPATADGLRLPNSLAAVSPLGTALDGTGSSTATGNGFRIDGGPQPSDSAKVLRTSVAAVTATDDAEGVPAAPSYPFGSSSVAAASSSSRATPAFVITLGEESCDLSTPADNTAPLPLISSLQGDASGCPAHNSRRPPPPLPPLVASRGIECDEESEDLRSRGVHADPNNNDPSPTNSSVTADPSAGAFFGPVASPDFTSSNAVSNNNEGEQQRNAPAPADEGSTGGLVDASERGARTESSQQASSPAATPSAEAGNEGVDAAEVVGGVNNSNGHFRSIGALVESFIFTGIVRGGNGAVVTTVLHEQQQCVPAQDDADASAISDGLASDEGGHAAEDSGHAAESLAAMADAPHTAFACALPVPECVYDGSYMYASGGGAAAACGFGARPSTARSAPSASGTLCVSSSTVCTASLTLSALTGNASGIAVCTPASACSGAHVGASAAADACQQQRPADTQHVAPIRGEEAALRATPPPHNHAEAEPLECLPTGTAVVAGCSHTSATAPVLANAAGNASSTVHSPLSAGGGEDFHESIASSTLVGGPLPFTPRAQQGASICGIAFAPLPRDNNGTALGTSNSATCIRASECPQEGRGALLTKASPQCSASLLLLSSSASLSTDPSAGGLSATPSTVRPRRAPSRGRSINPASHTIHGAASAGSCDALVGSCMSEGSLCPNNNAYNNSISLNYASSSALCRSLAAPATPLRPGHSSLLPPGPAAPATTSLSVPLEVLLVTAARSSSVASSGRGGGLAARQRSRDDSQVTRSGLLMRNPIPTVVPSDGAQALSIRGSPQQRESPENLDGRDMARQSSRAAGGFAALPLFAACVGPDNTRAYERDSLPSPFLPPAARARFDSSAVTISLSVPPGLHCLYAADPPPITVADYVDLILIEGGLLAAGAAEHQCACGSSLQKGMGLAYDASERGEPEKGATGACHISGFGSITDKEDKLAERWRLPAPQLSLIVLALCLLRRACGGTAAHEASKRDSAKRNEEGPTFAQKASHGDVPPAWGFRRLDRPTPPVHVGGQAHVGGRAKPGAAATDEDTERGGLLVTSRSIHRGLLASVLVASRGRHCPPLRLCPLKIDPPKWHEGEQHDGCTSGHGRKPRSAVPIDAEVFGLRGGAGVGEMAAMERALARASSAGRGKDDGGIVKLGTEDAPPTSTSTPLDDVCAEDVVTPSEFSAMAASLFGHAEGS